MRSLRKFVWAMCLALLLGSVAEAVHVRGYTRKDGTYVAPHERRSPGSGSSSGSSSASGNSSSSSVPSNAGRTSSYRSHSTHWSSSSSYAVPRDDHGRIVRSESARRQFMSQTGYPHGRPGYIVDHAVALKRGGADDPSNMQWQTIAEAKAKDKWE